MTMETVRRMPKAIGSRMAHPKGDSWRSPDVWKTVGHARVTRSYYALVDVGRNAVSVFEREKPIKDAWSTPIRKAFGYQLVGFDPSDAPEALPRVKIYRLEENAEVIVPNWRKQVPPYGIAPDGTLGNWLKFIWEYVAVGNGMILDGPQRQPPLHGEPKFTRDMVACRVWPLEPDAVAVCDCLSGGSPSGLRRG